jgi:quercetin dioxygenase-like cupin family protein
MPRTIRRIVTGHDKQGKAIFLRDEEIEMQSRWPGTSRANIWLTETTPAQISDEDMAKKILTAPPPLTGSLFRVVEFLPDQDSPHGDPKEVRRKMGVSLGGPEARHPAMHRTESIDYAIVLKGEIDMLVDDGEVHLTAGDVVIQGGCNHAWANRGDKPCEIAFVLIGAKVPWAGQGY